MDNIKYELIIFWSESDESFIVEVPELAGCKADGKTYEEAIANVKMVINDWIETATKMGREIPKPKGKLMYA
jgi:predicted RNase H-like HicB family nuclease